jgi:CRP-like cAMP-binding protein
MSKIDYKIIDASRNDLIFGPFEDAQYMGILLTGELYIERILPCGKNIPIFIKGPGDLFGEAAVFSDALTYPCNVYASKKSKVLLFSKNNVLKLLTLDNILLINLLSILANKALYLNNKIELLCFISIKQKIAYSILHDFNMCCKNETVCIPFSKKIWSETINVSRPSLYRELKLLESENIIKLNTGNLIQIINKEELRSIIMNG